jgi:signal transduction histidine kinase
MMRQTAYLQLLEAIATASNLTTTVEGAMQVALDRVCALTGWPVGHLFLVDRSEPDLLKPTTLWHLDDPSAFQAFRVETEHTQFRLGQGLPGRVLSTGQPVWVTDLASDPNFPRRHTAREVGLSSGFAFPITVGAEVVGVLEFYSPEATTPNRELMAVMSHVGEQLGRVIERQEAEQRVHEMNAALEQRVRERTEELQKANEELEAEIAERKRIEEERSQALTEEKRARERAEEAERRMASLADALDRSLAEEELLNAITTAASGEDDLGRMLASALGHLSKVVRFTGGSIDLVEGNDLVVASAVGPFAEIALGQRLARGVGRSWQVVTTREPFISGNLITDKLRPTSPIVSYLAVPLVWRGEAFGILQIDSTEADAFSQEDLRLMLKVGSSLSGPIEIARRYAAERQAVARAEEAIRTRDELLSVVSHDLRNPLAAILGNINLLKKRLARAGLTEEERERELAMLGRVKGAADRMVGLVEELLDFGHLQAGQDLSLQIREVDLVALAREGVADHQQATARHTITLLADEENLPIRVDATRIERVLANLLTNAIKYSPNGGTITVRVSRTKEQGHSLALLEVTDTGMGIPEDEQPYIFEWFRRAENVSGRISGSGIGLATSRLIVEQHGGTIDVQSRVGEGSTFTVRLPL